MKVENHGELTISQINTKLGEIYKNFKTANGGKKTTAKGKYGFKTLSFQVRDGEKSNSFFGRGSALSFFRKNHKKGEGVGVQFVVQEVFKPKDKAKIPTIDVEHVMTLGSKIKNASSTSITE